VKTFKGKLSHLGALALAAGITVLVVRVSYWFIPAYLLAGTALCWWSIPGLHLKHGSRVETIWAYVFVAVGWAIYCGTCLVLVWDVPDRELTVSGLIRETLA
jgi:hypothetical protein